MSDPAIPVSPDATVADIVTRHPETLPVFERLGIDYCCGGGRPIGDAVAAGGLSWAEVSAQIGAALAEAVAIPAQPSWAEAPLAALMGHIVDRYHGKLRERLPMLSQMGEKVINAHGDRHPEVKEVAVTLGALPDIGSEIKNKGRSNYPALRSSHPHIGPSSTPA